MSSAPIKTLSEHKDVRGQVSFFRSVFALMLREMSTRYGRSPGGYVWALLEPLGSIIVLSVAFSLVLRTPSLGTSFILFYATGFLPFNLYQSVSSTIASSLMFSKPLLFYPAVTWIDAVTARFILNTLTGVLIMILLIFGIVLFSGVTLLIEVPPLLLSLCLALLLAAGIGVMNAALYGIFPVWQQIWSIATRPLFLVSGVFFVYEDLPKAAQDLIWYNPLMHITGLARDGFYATYSPTYISIAYTAAWGLIPMFFGTLLLVRYHRDILND